ncbi:MAG: TRAP transporter substrate-binding protein DctP [Ketobacteraceae bacterium]|nr:TRAP transporter substrate-binding protein DctP [Ketobacteraceae bacterium]
MEKNRDPDFKRRDFLNLVKTFGLTSTLLGVSQLSHSGGLISRDALAAATTDIAKKRTRKKPRFTLKFGGAGFDSRTLNIERQGGLIFVSDIEERTDGEIKVEFIGSNQICSQLNCVKMCQEGLVDLYISSTQNASAIANYFNVLDFAYLWPSRAAQYYFLYHPESERLFREPLREHHGLQFLWSLAELRNVMLGLKYKKASKIMTIDELKGMKIRVTGTRLGRLSMKLMGMNPVPVAWEETKTFLKAGIIDGAETFSSAVAYSDLSPAISQDVRCQFLSGFEHTAMNLNKFRQLGAELQKALMESAYLTQVHVQGVNEAALLNLIGITAPPLPGTFYHRYGIRNCIWSKSELEKAERMSSPKYNPEPWQEWREKLNVMAGGVDVFEAFYSIGREIPPETQAIDITPRRWWKS